MLELELQPGIGVGPIKLGGSQSAVRQALKDFGFELDASHGRSDYFDGIQVEYTNYACTFIGVCWSKRYILKFQETDVFNISAEKLFDLLEDHDGSGKHEFNIYEYEFPNQLVRLWDADKQYDRMGRESRVVWAQVGLLKQMPP